MRDGLDYTTIIAELKSRGEKFNTSNLSRHKPHVARAVDERMTAEIEESIVKLRGDASAAPAVLRPAYVTIIRFLESVNDRAAPNVREVLAAAESIHRITGMSGKHEFLLAFAERAWLPGGAMSQPDVGAQEKDFPSIPTDLLVQSESAAQHSAATGVEDDSLPLLPPLTTEEPE
jgi:hypothetical protein